jgi:peptidoglycan/LPS O-acetylase OafA/YrhL
MRNVQEFNTNIQGSRGLFAFLVLVSHVENSGLNGGGPGWLHFALSSFQYGVELFFCISGYVITMSLMRAPSAGRFLLDRALRIMPVFLTLQVILFAVGTTFIHEHLFAVMHGWSLVWLLVADSLLLPGIFPIPAVQEAAWSLSYEFAFYLLVCVYWFAGWRLKKWQRIAIAAIAVTVFVDIYPRAIFFSVGVITYVMQAGAVSRWGNRPWTRLSPFAYLCVMLFSWRMIRYLSNGLQIDGMMLHQWLGDVRIFWAVVAYVSGLLFFVTMYHDQGIYGRLMRTRVFQWMGSISYSFYLWHPIVMFATKRFLVNSLLPIIGDGWGQLAFFLLSLPIAMVAAHASYILIERHLTKWVKSRLSARAIPVQQPSIARPMVASSRMPSPAAQIAGGLRIARDLNKSMGD